MTTALQKKSGKTDLSLKAREINEQLQLADEGMRTGIEHALRAGSLLTEAKDKLPHGAFSNWVSANCRCTNRTAQKYMRAAKCWPEIEAQATSLSLLTLTDGLALVADHINSPAIDDRLVPPDGYAAFGETLTDDGTVEVLVSPSGNAGYYFVTVIGPFDPEGPASRPCVYSQKPFSGDYIRKVLGRYVPAGTEIDELEWAVYEWADDDWGADSTDHPLHRPYWRYPEPETDDPTGRLAELEKTVCYARNDFAAKLAAITAIETEELYAYGFGIISDYLKGRFGLGDLEMDHVRYFAEHGTAAV